MLFLDSENEGFDEISGRSSIITNNSNFATISNEMDEIGTDNSDLILNKVNPIDKLYQMQQTYFDYI